MMDEFLSFVPSSSFINNYTERNCTKSDEMSCLIRFHKTFSFFFPNKLIKVVTVTVQM